MPEIPWAPAGSARLAWLVRVAHVDLEALARVAGGARSSTAIWTPTAVG